MNHHVNAISSRLSLRPPQWESLERLHRVMEIAHLEQGWDRAAVLEVIKGEFPAVTDFKRAFPSLCFALATGVGKTRLMGAFIFEPFLTCTGVSPYASRRCSRIPNSRMRNISSHR